MEFEGEDGFSNSKFVMVCVVRGKIDFPELILCSIIATYNWAFQDLNLGPTDYESAALTN